MKKFLLVYNPVSGDAYFKYSLDSIIEKFLKKQCVLIPFRTSRENMHQCVQVLKEIPVDGIIISGGDGTVHSVVNMLLEESIDLPIGIIPSGTCNDFADYLGIGDNIDSYLEVIVNGCALPVDVGKINNKYFINVASAGLLTSVAHSVDATLKNTLGKVAYYLRGLGELPNFRPLTMTITADATVIRESIYMFLVLNSGTVGSFSNIIPAKLDDGKLDILIVKQCNISELMSLFMGLVTGKNPSMYRNVQYLQAKKITIHCTEEVVSDVDGELGPKLPLEIEAVPGRIRLFCDDRFIK